MIFWLFLALMLLAVTIVLFLGQFEERLAITILIANFIGTGIIYRFDSGDWLQPQIGIFALDLVALIILTVIAMRSKRFWPLPIAAFQIIPVLTFFVTWVGEDLKSYGLGVTQGFWGYLQLAILISAAITGWKRRKLEREMSIP